MAILLGIDFETTGLNPQEDKIIEAGFCLWDTDLQTPLKMKSYLVAQPVIISPEITAINGITQEMMDGGYPESSIKYDLEQYEKHADYFVAHNAGFEKGFLSAMGLDPDAVQWIDTKTDLPYPKGKGEGSLTLIAANHGFVNPFPHRALPDVLTMLKILSLYDFAEVERYSQAETVNITAVFPYDATGQRQTQIKGLGYYWNPAGKYWHKPVKEFLAEQHMEAAREAGFRVVLEPIPA